MDIVVKGRNVEVPEHYRVHVAEKLARIERYDRKVIRFDVELFHEPNRRQAKSCQRVEITGVGKGPAIRAEACAADFYAALDCAMNKLESRFRKMHDRRKVHHGRRRPESVAAATSGQANIPVAAAGTAVLTDERQDAEDTLSPDPIPTVPDTVQPDSGQPDSAPPDSGTTSADSASTDNADVPWPRVGETGAESDHGPGQIVRRKQHSGTPISVDEALYQMELVGHDFYLFKDADSGAASVVYRRRGFDYGVIALVE